MNKKSINFSMLATMVAMSLYLFGFSAVSQAEEEAIARVIVSSGHFAAIQPDGKERVLKRRSAIFVGDTLTTSEDGRAQIRFKDGALVDIQAATQLRLDEYNYQGKVDGSEKNTMSLIKGGFRTISGIVGKKNKKNYKVNTPVATIGIRGTHYGLHYCGGDCGVNTGSGEFQNKKGLYGGVVDGAVVANNESGEIRLGNDQYFHVESKTSEPTILLIPPSIIFQAQETVAIETTGETDTTTEEILVLSDVTPPPEESIAALPPSPEPMLAPEPVPDTATPDLTYKQLKSGVMGFAYVTGSPADASSGLSAANFAKVYVNDNNEPVYIYHVGTNCDPCIVEVTGSTATGKSSNNVLGVNWGRWATADYVVTENGISKTPDKPLNYIYSDNVTSGTRLVELASKYSTVTYSATLAGADGSMIMGTDSYGNDIASGSTLSVEANFTSQAFTDASYSFVTSQDTWSGTMDSSYGDVSFSDNTISLTGGCSGTNCLDNTTGNMNATFVGSNAEGIMSTFSIKGDTTDIGISGAGLMVK